MIHTSDNPVILGIETSCDETAAAVLAGRRLLASIVASQMDIHARYGGIVPEVASRQHLLAILPTVEHALSRASIVPKDLTAIAVTYGPGLAGSLLVGLNLAKALSLAWGLPLIGVNHLEAHIYANWVRDKEDNGKEPAFPLLCLIVSGGHSDLVLMEKHLQYKLLGRTRDDAAGEAFDKAARLLGLGFPGGPAIQEAARQGNSRKVKLPRAWLRGSDDFSFSGLKTALFHLMTGKSLTCRSSPDAQTSIYDAAASFQEAVVDVLVTKTIAAARKYGVKQLLLAGGVAANTSLRCAFQEKSPVPLSIPPPHLCTDNAAMVAACGCYCWKVRRLSGYNLDVVADLPLASLADPDQSWPPHKRAK
jgi:N6-L-threonylcarbamoyladenine synthase